MKFSSDAQAEEIIQHKWDETMKKNELDKLSLSDDSMALLKSYFARGFNSGETFMYNTMQNIHDENPSLFSEFFEE